MTTSKLKKSWNIYAINLGEILKAQLLRKILVVRNLGKEHTIEDRENFLQTELRNHGWTNWQTDVELEIVFQISLFLQVLYVMSPVHLYTWIVSYQKTQNWTSPAFDLTQYWHTKKHQSLERIIALKIHYKTMIFLWKLVR